MKIRTETPGNLRLYGGSPTRNEKEQVSISSFYYKERVSVWSVELPRCLISSHLHLLEITPLNSTLAGWRAGFACPVIEAQGDTLDELFCWLS